MLFIIQIKKINYQQEESYLITEQFNLFQIKNY